MDIAALLPQFGGFFMTIVAFVVALSVIVAVHEYGHYIVGRWSGIKAEVFSLGFGPVLWSRMDRHGTRWQIAALPFGGFVKFLGDANAASAKNDEAVAEMPPEIRRQTMHGAPLWARTATVAAGPVFNFVLSILIFAAVMMTQGKVADPLTVGELRPLPGDELTLQAGDRLLQIEGRDVPGADEDKTFSDLIDELPIRPVLTYQVERDGQQIQVQGPYPMPPLVVQLAPQSAAYDISMQPGDVITSIDGTPIAAFSELKEVVEASDGRPLELKVWRDGATLDFVLAPRRVDEPRAEGGFHTTWRIGIAGGLAFEPATEALGPVQALAGGAIQVWRIIEGSVSGLYHMVTGAISSCNMSGPIGIAEVSGAMASQGAESFIWFIAVLSAAVGFLNLFPIPVLDGGHLAFYAYEAVAGKPPSDAALRLMMAIGLTLVLGLMLFALFNDIFCP
ncbi:regulator of sigma E protease [Roseovarius pacificus]|uniref:Zinc metalloprotease n=1 Tax=Roseovarius pacificus TaxID=337701 RepID=A0A1M6WZJ2_9RHOB|nr:RIP metalloprotease RseP [Roseovarius pacificus]GGO52737.1 zinc metalloprotease [Roseovarius pacificus]SHK99157.1 regulator of sigma E protease [Roseovarius pacificus]